MGATWAVTAIRGSLADLDPALLRPEVEPRESWADSIRIPRGLVQETDVRFLIVHHTQTPNGERGGKVPARLRQIHRYHTTEKGWSDIAYNFLVDETGTIWEGRAGSLAGPVRGDATGGSQGFAVLCCFIGDHSLVKPSLAAIESMVLLLAWQAVLNGVELSPDRVVTFRSRGSNRWAKGTLVKTAPIAGHRDMSATACPGNAAYALISDRLWPAAYALVLAAASPEAVASPRAQSDVPAPSFTETAAPPTQPSAPNRASSRVGKGSNDSSKGELATGAGIAGLVASSGLAWVIARRMRNPSAKGRTSTDDT